MAQPWLSEHSTALLPQRLKQLLSVRADNLENDSDASYSPLSADSGGEDEDAPPAATPKPDAAPPAPPPPAPPESHSTRPLAKLSAQLARCVCEGPLRRVNRDK